MIHNNIKNKKLNIKQNYRLNMTIKLETKEQNK